MILGIPKEIKAQEYRVALTPERVGELIREGHRLLVEKGAGLGSGYSDQQFRDQGAVILSEAQKIWAEAECILKVKEPLPKEYRFFKPDLILFTFLHLASQAALLKALVQKKVSAIGYETVRDVEGAFPLLRPMSIIAGKLAVLLGAQFLRTDGGKKGILLSKVEGARAGRVTILGAGNVGRAALEVALGVGAEVSLFDKNEERLAQLQREFSQHSFQVSSELDNNTLEKKMRMTDLLIGAVLQPAARAPRLVNRALVSTMEKGSVIIDVSVDQGACIETIQPTTHAKPIFEYKGILHYGVANMPSLVSRTATEALVAQTFPYIKKLANEGLKALEQDSGFQTGLQIQSGKIIHPVLRELFI